MFLFGRNRMKRAKHPHANAFVRQGLFENLNSFSELEKRISSLPTENLKGYAFEVFAEAYLATQKIVQACEVWPGNSIPLDVLKAHSLPFKDLGADGVFRSYSGQLKAYQVKYRTSRVPLTWEELGTFMGLTDQVDERVLFTNSNDLPSVMNERSRFFCIRGSDLDRLAPEDFRAINEWMQTGQFVITRKNPLPHQAEALTEILTGLENHDRATAVMACGTGKTLVALWLAERMQCRRIIVLVPSLALVRQTLHEWLKETKWRAPNFICVCSDSTVAKNSDELVVRQSDVDFPVTTKSEEVRRFLIDNSGDAQVVFTTYQSSQVVGEAAKGLPAFQLGIFDEAHKTAGREGTSFGFALTDKNLTIEKRLFLTATPRHYDITRKDKEGEAKEVFSMDVPAVYGPRVYTLPFAEAARRGIICDYKVIISVVTSDMVNDELLRHGEVIVEGDVVRARQVANQIALQKACEEHNLKKVFTFHTRVEAAREFTGKGGQSISSYLPQYRALHVSGDMPTARREMLMTTFKEADKAVISNARCLTEGVDVPAVDMVAFMSPKKSKVDIIQATGRAMRKAAHKKIGYVLVPLYLEISANETIEEALQRTDYGGIWDVLQAMKEQDHVLEDIIRQLQIEKGKTGSFDSSRTSERLEILGPELSLDELRQTISISIIEQLGVTWDQRYGELARYKERFGNCNVPTNWPENTPLGTWVAAQRYTKKTGKISNERISRLEELGFEWVLDRWAKQFEDLVCFKKRYGHCNVPREWPEDKSLSDWVGAQRYKKLTGQLESDRERALSELGFKWDIFQASWDKKFAELEQYKNKHGDCNTPKRSKEYRELGTWVAEQRKAHRKGKLDITRVKRLESLGIVWDRTIDAWETHLPHLMRYKQEHGHCSVPNRYPQNMALGRWVCQLRKDKERLEPERIQQLEQIGFNWDPINTAWESKFAELLRFKEQHGHCVVPQKDPQYRKLGIWVGEQRRAMAPKRPEFEKSNKKRRTLLESDKVKRLEEIGFEWNPGANMWERRLAELAEFKKDHGHCNVPQRWQENIALAKWVRNQRADMKDGNMLPERRARLDKLGFEWNLIVSEWEKKFSELKRFQLAHGHCSVPIDWPDNQQLANWARDLRRAATRKRLSDEQRKRLEALGFCWRDKGSTRNQR